MIDDTANRAGAVTDFPTTARIVPWPDPALERRGHDPRSLYVEQFWLGVIGPTATWLLRRIAARLDARPDGFLVDCQQLAGELGLSVAKGHASPFAKAMHRCVMFQAARPIRDARPGWEVRRRLPTVPQRHLRRLPEQVQTLHASWDHTGGDGQLTAS